MPVSKLTHKRGCRKVDLIILQRVPPPVLAHQPTDEEPSVPNSYGEILPNADFLKQHFFHEGRLTEAQALCILQKATNLLSREPNLVNVESPVTSECASLDRKWACELNHSKYEAISMGNTCVINGFDPMRALRFWGADSMI